MKIVNIGIQSDRKRLSAKKRAQVKLRDTLYNESRESIELILNMSFMLVIREDKIRLHSLVSSMAFSLTM